MMAGHTLSHLPPTTFNPKYIRRYWEVIARDGGPREIRILNTEKDGTVAGIFATSDIEHAMTDLERWDGVRSIYLTLNPLKPEMLARENAGTLMRWTKTTAQDTDVARRVWLMIDVDPTTAVTGIAATDEERNNAIEVRDSLASWLAEAFAFADPVRGHTGNGGRLLYAIDLPNDPASTDLVKRCLATLDHHWSSPQAKIDTAVYNAARIDKLWGTMAVKGADTPGRPHRRSFLDWVPPSINDVSREQLEQLAASGPAAAGTSTREIRSPSHDGKNLVPMFEMKGLYLRPSPKEGGTHLVTCLWVEAHSMNSGKTETVYYEPSAQNNGAGGFKCMHASCSTRTIADVYQFFEVEVAAAPGYLRDHEAPKLETVAELQDRLGEHVEWLVENMFAVGDMSELAAKAGVGKSTFAAQLAVAVAYGKPFLGRATRQGVVVILAFEGARSTMAHMVRLGHDRTSRNILMWSAATGKDPAAWLDATLKQAVPALIIVDTLADFARARHGAANAGYDDMIEKLGAVYLWAQNNRSHVHLLHHGGKGNRDGIDAPHGSIANVTKPGTVLDYRPMNPQDENSPRVLKGTKHREGDKERDLPAVVLDFDRDRGLTVAGFRQEVAVRELGVAIIKVVAQTPDVKQVEVMAEIEGRKASKLEALRLLTDPTAGVLVRTGTAGSRTSPLRLSVRQGLDGDPVEVWRGSASRFPRGPVGSHSSGTYSNRMPIGDEPVGSRLPLSIGNLLTQKDAEKIPVGSHDYSGGVGTTLDPAREPTREPTQSDTETSPDPTNGLEQDRWQAAWNRA